MFHALHRMYLCKRGPLLRSHYSLYRNNSHYGQQTYKFSHYKRELPIPSISKNHDIVYVIRDVQRDGQRVIDIERHTYVGDRAKTFKEYGYDGIFNVSNGDWIFSTIAANHKHNE